MLKLIRKHLNRPGEDSSREKLLQESSPDKENFLQHAPEAECLVKVQRRSSFSASIFNVLLGCVVFAQTAALIYLTQVSSANHATRFATDLSSVPKQNIVQTSFSGGVQLTEDGAFYRHMSPESSQFVGEPSQEVDTAWDYLLSGLNLDLHRHEMGSFADQTYEWKASGTYFSGYFKPNALKPVKLTFHRLEVFHSLHCLNRIRQAFFPDYYPWFGIRKDQPSRQMHIDHCIDHIRQSLQCHADLTPMEWRLQDDKFILKTKTRHTCRDFKKIHLWARTRTLNYSSKAELTEEGIKIVD